MLHIAHIGFLQIKGRIIWDLSLKPNNTSEEWLKEQINKIFKIFIMKFRVFKI